MQEDLKGQAGSVGFIFEAVGSYGRFYSRVATSSGLYGGRREVSRAGNPAVCSCCAWTGVVQGLLTILCYIWGP